MYVNKQNFNNDFNAIKTLCHDPRANTTFNMGSHTESSELIKSIILFIILIIFFGFVVTKIEYSGIRIFSEKMLQN